MSEKPSVGWKRSPVRFRKGVDLTERLPDYLYPGIVAQWAREGAFVAAKLTNLDNIQEPDPKDVQILWRNLTVKEIETIGRSLIEYAEYMKVTFRPDKIGGRVRRLRDRALGAK